MKIFFAFILLAIIFSACNKNCNTDTEACMDTVPTDQDCEAAFSRWFYNASSKSCELKSYSGCSQEGFETKEECETCKCN